MKARFRRPKDAEVVVPLLTRFLAECRGAYDYWQNCRDWQPVPRKLPTAAEFWAPFRERFPKVYRYLGELAGVENWNNGLAGNLSVGSPAGGEPELWREGNSVYLILYSIWHAADLTLLEEFVQVEYGAEAVAWVSAEQFEEVDEPDPYYYFDAIEL
jgi:hypothetical protein